MPFFFFLFLHLVLLEYSGFFFWLYSHINYLWCGVQQFTLHEDCSWTWGRAERGGWVTPAGSSRAARSFWVRDYWFHVCVHFCVVQWEPQQSFKKPLDKNTSCVCGPAPCPLLGAGQDCSFRVWFTTLLSGLVAVAVEAASFCRKHQKLRSAEV